MTESVVYLLKVPNLDRYKIGTTTNLEQRLKAYTTHNGVGHTLIATWPGDRRLESDLHQFLAPYRILEEGVGDEWFELHVADLMTVIVQALDQRACLAATGEGERHVSETHCQPQEGDRCEVLLGPLEGQRAYCEEIFTAQEGDLEDVPAWYMRYAKPGEVLARVLLDPHGATNSICSGESLGAVVLPWASLSKT